MTANAPPRPIARFPGLGLVLDCNPAGELVAQTFDGGVIELVYYASTSSRSCTERSQRGKRYWHKQLTDDQRTACDRTFDRAAAQGKPFKNDWRGVPTQDDPGILPPVPVIDLELYPCL